MSFRFLRKALIFSLLTFVIIAGTAVFNFSSTSPTTKNLNAKRDQSASEPEGDAPKPKIPRDVPYLQEPTERVELINLDGWNTVMCWPSVGGIIVNTHISSVELDFLKLPRFESPPRSNNASEEDEICRQLHKTGGKWWDSYGDFIDAVDSKIRPTSAKEREALLLGWPEDGGVWFMRETNWYYFGREPGMWRMRNAYTMEERCKAVEMSGAIYYKNPEDCDSVKPLLNGFGEHEREEMSSYYFDYDRDFFG